MVRPETVAKRIAKPTGERLRGGSGWAWREPWIALSGHQFNRFLEPHGESKRYGRDYELWTGSGGNAVPLSDLFLRQRGYATRVDVAFDFEVEPHVRANEDVFKPLFEEAQRRGFKPDQAGVINPTMYIGCRPRRLRIYRKDKEDPTVVDPTIRIELELGKPHAEPLHRVLREAGRDEFIAAAAAHVEYMTGFAPVEPDVIPLSDQAEPEADIGQRVFAWAQQNAGMVCGLVDAGVEPDDLVAFLRDFQAQQARASKYRWRAFVFRARCIGAINVLNAARSVLKHRRPSAA